VSNIKSILASGGNQILSVAPDDNILETLKKLSEYGVGALLVLEHDNLVGIVSERDYARKVILEGKNSTDTKVKEIMTPNPITVGANDSLKTCMETMTNNHIRHLPVVDNGKILGVLSNRDLLKAVISQQEFLIDQLESYIQTGQM